MSEVTKIVRGKPVHLNVYFGALLAATTLLIYQPAWTGKPIMDDRKIVRSLVWRVFGISRARLSPGKHPPTYGIGDIAIHGIPYREQAM